MHSRLNEAFDRVQAGEELKAGTKAFLAQKTKGYTRSTAPAGRRLIPALVCTLLFLLGGYWLYFTPTAAISIDINPSIELGVNRFDKIISIQSFNDDGQELADTLRIKYQDYADAVLEILQDPTISSMLSNGEVMSIGVIGAETAQSSEILAELESCTAGEQNTYCYYARREDVEDARQLGLSYGKYRAFLEVQALDPDITAEEIRDMTMREIRDLIGSLSGTDTSGGGRGPGSGTTPGAGGPWWAS